MLRTARRTRCRLPLDILCDSIVTGIRPPPSSPDFAGLQAKAAQYMLVDAPAPCLRQHKTYSNRRGNGRCRGSGRRANEAWSNGRARLTRLRVWGRKITTRRYQHLNGQHARHAASRETRINSRDRQTMSKRSTSTTPTQDTGTHSSAAPLSPSNEPKQDDPNPIQTTGRATRPCRKLINDHHLLENLD